jgi:hypothetical protein
MANEYRVTTVSDEVLHAGSSAARVSATSLEVLRDTVAGPTLARVSTLAVQVLRSVDAVSASNRRMSLM